MYPDLMTIHPSAFNFSPSVVSLSFLFLQVRSDRVGAMAGFPPRGDWRLRSSFRRHLRHHQRLHYSRLVPDKRLCYLACFCRSLLTMIVGDAFGRDGFSRSARFGTTFITDAFFTTLRKKSLDESIVPWKSHPETGPIIKMILSNMVFDNALSATDKTPGDKSVDWAATKILFRVEDCRQRPFTLFCLDENLSFI